jgi:hypothetical protein
MVDIVKNFMLGFAFLGRHFVPGRSGSNSSLRGVLKVNAEEHEDFGAKRLRMARHFGNFAALSASGEFVAINSPSAGLYIARFNLTSLVPLATIKSNGDICGILGNGGDRFARLSEIERVDCATLVGKLRNQGVI